MIGTVPKPASRVYESDVIRWDGGYFFVVERTGTKRLSFRLTRTTFGTIGGAAEPVVVTCNPASILQVVPS